MKVDCIKYFFLTISLVLLLSCKKTETTDLSQKHKRFVQVYIELRNLRKDFPNKHTAISDSARAVLQKYNFTEEEYKRSLTFFNEKPERWEIFYHEVLEQLKKE